MADRVIKHNPLAPGDLPVKFKDLGDGTFALYLALEPASIGGGGAGGGATTIADGADVAQGSKADAAWVSGSGSVIALLKTIASSGAAAGLTDTQLRATPVPVSGSFFQATQPVSGAFWQTTQPVSLATAPSTPVTGTFWQATQPISGTVSLAANTPDVTDRAARVLGVTSSEGAIGSAPPANATYLMGRDTGGIGAFLRTLRDSADGEATQTANMLGVSSRPYMFNGTTWDRLRGAAATGLLVNVSNASLPVTGTFWQTTQPVSLAVAPTTPVTGTFWQATQPVSLAVAPTTPVTGTFWQATQPVSGPLTDTQLRASAVPVSGSFFQATQPVSAAALPLPAGAATSANQPTIKAASAIAAATDTAAVVQQAPQRGDAANLCVTTTAATGVAATLTIPAAAAGLFHYISLIEMELYATAARTGGATPVVVTSTNLPGSPAWDFDTAQAIGATIRKVLDPSTPIKSSVAATATTIVAPIATTGIWRITAYYYTAP